MRSPGCGRTQSSLREGRATTASQQKAGPAWKNKTSREKSQCPTKPRRMLSCSPAGPRETIPNIKLQALNQLQFPHRQGLRDTEGLPPPQATRFELPRAVLRVYFRNKTPPPPSPYTYCIRDAFMKLPVSAKLVTRDMGEERRSGPAWRKRPLASRVRIMTDSPKQGWSVGE